MKKLIYCILALSAAIVISLVLHIYDVSTVDTNANLRQLARIDIVDALDESEAIRLRSAMNRVEGVSHAYINPDSRRLIFSFNPRTHNAEALYQELQQQSSYALALYQPSADLAAAGCPALIDKGLSKRIVSWFK